MIIGFALLIYALAERKLWQGLQEMIVTVPDQRRKPTESPTIHWLSAFKGLGILLVKQNGQVLLRQLLNLRSEHEQVITLLGLQVKNAIYSVRKMRNVGRRTGAVINEDGAVWIILPHSPAITH